MELLARIGRFTPLQPLVHRDYPGVYEKIYALKPKPPLAPQPRLLRRFIRQMIASVLKRQPQKGEGHSPDEVMQQLKKLERQIEAVERAVARQVKRK